MWSVASKGLNQCGLYVACTELNQCGLYVACKGLNERGLYVTKEQEVHIFSFSSFTSCF